ncbi:TPA: hypothetical protein DCX30_00170 [Candidatus Beckwithbacteria bacterium]|nr:hypothetical protein [Candidatus Beckwithbacteria bacterium]
MVITLISSLPNLSISRSRSRPSRHTCQLLAISGFIPKDISLPVDACQIASTDPKYFLSSVNRFIPMPANPATPTQYLSSS